MMRLVWLVMVVLVSPALSAAVPSSHLEWARKNQGRFAYGIYFQEKKVGWVVEEMKVKTEQGKEVLVSTSHTYMATLFDGEKSIKEEKSSTTYDLTGEGVILSGESVRKDDGKEVVRRVERDGDRLKISTLQGGRTLVRHIPFPKDTVANQRDLETWLTGKRQRDDTFTKFSSAWEEQDVNSKQIYRYKGKKRILHRGELTDLFQVEINLDGGKLESDVFSDSRAYRGSMGGLLTMKLEPEKLAKALDGPPVDLLPVTSVKIAEDLGPSRQLIELTMRLQGLGDFEIPASHRQQIRTDPKGVVVTLRRDFVVEKPVKLSDDQIKEYLSATPRIQSDQDQVRELARKIVGKTTDPMEKGKKIEAWVFRKLRKSYSDNADTALEILDHMAGDCTEHSLLFVSLARAVGLPCREVGGLAFISGPNPSFGWHAWAEFHDGRQWVSVDPTWNQVFVDASHLKMSSGEKDLAWTNVIGTLKMDVLESRKRGKDSEK
ncbi:MAG: transglutaminase-like domain-containing protein [Gemmataceae bacterium]